MTTNRSQTVRTAARRGSDSYANIVEENSLLGSTTFRWQHKIYWDWRIDNKGGRIYNTRNKHSPKHTTYFMSYDGKVDEWEKIDRVGKTGPQDNIFQERYISYIQGHMEHFAPVIGVSAYDGYPYSKLLGRDGGSDTDSWTIDSGIET
ncbi:hypothetical protein [Natrinema halophilum]|uniref:Uncharacterized protein n=1 Tax=Natrinema halophilum TaxID=1699371 RepID=A0A7D5L3H1_9EURY|nr:hypothetical protein [Natrinema halophilum]QLG49865.1 hypothetical protein HYG82_13860 [Natrinema halophilum]